MSAKLLIELCWHYLKAGVRLLIGIALAALGSAILASPLAIVGEYWFGLAALALFPFFLGHLVLSDAFVDLIGAEECERAKAIRVEIHRRRLDRLSAKDRRS